MRITDVDTVNGVYGYRPPGADAVKVRAVAVEWVEVPKHPGWTGTKPQRRVLVERGYPGSETLTGYRWHVPARELTPWDAVIREREDTAAADARVEEAAGLARYNGALVERYLSRDPMVAAAVHRDLITGEVTIDAALLGAALRDSGYDDMVAS